jgi:hypothetical protein
MLRKFCLAIVACCSILHAQEASTPEPQYSQQYNAVVGGQLVVLERQTAVTDTKSRRFFVITPSTKVFESIKNPASPIRVGPNTHFVVRISVGDRDPQTLIHLQKLTPAKTDRQVPIITYKVSLIPGGGVNHKRAPDDPIPINIQKYGEKSLEIIPQQALEPGEYAFMAGHEAQCFGVDAGLSSGNPPSAAASSQAAPPPSPAKVPAPTPPPPPPAPTTGKAGDFPAGPGLPVLHTDRTPYPGCQWSPVVSKRYGFAILVMNCTGPGSESMPKYAADDPGFINSYVDDQRLNAADPKNAHSATIEVFTKPAAQTLDTAVRQQILSTVKPRWRASCHVKLSKEQQPGIQMQTYDFTSTTGPGVQASKKADFTDALPCSPWEASDSESNFYYKPSESRTTFFFSNTGQEPPNYEMDSIRFLSPDASTPSQR